LLPHPGGRHRSWAPIAREILANLLDNARRHAVSRLELTVTSEP
jgi:signal transduction histidine kinase